MHTRQFARYAALASLLALPIQALDLGLQANPDRSQDATMGFIELGVVYCPTDTIDLSLGVIRDLMDGPSETTTATAEVTLHF